VSDARPSDAVSPCGREVGAFVCDMDAGHAGDCIPTNFEMPVTTLYRTMKPRPRFGTGFATIDAATRGGLPTGTLVTVQGPPEAGKTGFLIQVATTIAIEHDAVTIIFPPDGGSEAAALRIGAVLGLDPEKLEAQDLDEMNRLNDLLADRRLFIANYASEEYTLKATVEAARNISPNLPHILVVDTAQEARAGEDAEQLSERDRTIAVMRLAQNLVTVSYPEWLALIASQTTKAGFGSGRGRDRVSPMGAGADTAKVAFLSNVLIHLDGDPAIAPDFARARFIKNKLGRIKPELLLRFAPGTLRLEEVARAEVEAGRDQAKTEARDQARADRLGKLKARALAELRKGGKPETRNVFALRRRLSCKKLDLVAVLGELEAEGEATCETTGPQRAHTWTATPETQTT
jgi:hypothetical protein